MTTEHHIPRPPSRRRLLLLTAVALAAATVVMVVFVLPTEFQVDPAGVGRLTGLNHLAATKTVTVAVPAGPAAVARYYSKAYRTDVIEIPLAASGGIPGGDELEYKVRMKKGASLVYSWSVPGVTDPEEFYFDFHGETPASAANPEAIVVEYLQTTGTHSNGVLVAPIEGLHGWYLQNQSIKPVVVHLRLSGFYDLVPPGEYGNRAGIVAHGLEGE